MIKQWISWINIGIISLIACLLGISAVTILARPSDIPVTNQTYSSRPLPTPPFALPKEAYEEIGKSGCQLKFCPLSVQIPDLRRLLIYQGKNGRPDAQAGKQFLHFSFINQGESFTVVAGEPTYLRYNRELTPPQYTYSPDNQETPLWFQASLQGQEVVINLCMRDENNKIIQEPKNLSRFTLPEKEVSRNAHSRTWEIGKWRVDGSLLARQKTRWMGKDLFLERHGGTEFQAQAEKYRIDFTDEEENYSVFVGLNDILVWSDDRWQVVIPGSESQGRPLMIVKKIDDRLMNLELWDVDGKQKLPLTLIKIHESWPEQRWHEKFQCLGARTRSQYIFEIDSQRMLLSPKDWLLQTDKGWTKLTTPEEVDDYVDRKLTGLLFVFDGVVRQQGKQVFQGVVFNSSRTEMHELAIPVIQGGASHLSNKLDGEESDDEDDFDYDLDDDF